MALETAFIVGFLFDRGYSTYRDFFEYSQTVSLDTMPFYNFDHGPHLPVWLHYAALRRVS